MAEQDFENPRVWEVTKPFLTDFFVPFSIYDPDFHKRSITKDPAPLDPCCSSCRGADDSLTVCVYVEDESCLPAWEFVLSHAPAIESALKTKLLAMQARYIAELLEDNLPGMPAWQKHWEYVQSELSRPAEQAIDRMFKWTGVSIVRSDPEAVWLVGYEFQTAWDMDHGVEVLMWDDRMLTADGMMTLNSTGHSPLESAKYNQQYQFDPGDFRLE